MMVRCWVEGLVFNLVEADCECYRFSAAFSNGPTRNAMFNSLQRKVVTKLKVSNCVRRLTVSSSSAMPSKKRKSGDDNGSVTEPAAAKKPKEEKKNKSSTEWEEVEWTSEAKTGDDKPWNLKLASWNVDGLRAWHGKGGAEFLQHEAPDVLCLQETKVKEEKLPEDMKSVPGYPHCYWLAAQKDGYSGGGRDQYSHINS